MSLALGLLGCRSASRPLLNFLLNHSPAVRAAALSTSRPALFPPPTKDAFENYEKAAIKEPKHFQEDRKSNALIAVAKDENTQEYLLPHPIWSEREVENVQITHRSAQLKSHLYQLLHFSIYSDPKFSDLSMATLYFYSENQWASWITPLITPWYFSATPSTWHPATPLENTCKLWMSGLL